MSALLTTANSFLKRKLEVWEPITPMAHLRTLYVEKRLHDQVANASDYRMGELANDFDHFCCGKLTVGYFNDSHCFMKHLNRIKDEVWEMRCTEPEPQIRIFGRFLATDTFLATHMTYRTGLEFDDEKAKCAEIWESILGKCAPHCGKSVADYLSQRFTEISRRPQ